MVLCVSNIAEIYESDNCLKCYLTFIFSGLTWHFITVKWENSHSLAWLSNILGVTSCEQVVVFKEVSKVMLVSIVILETEVIKI